MAISDASMHVRHDSRESFKLERSDQSLLNSQLPDDEEDDYQQSYPTQSLWSRVLDTLNPMSIRRRRNHSYGPGRSEILNKFQHLSNGSSLPRRATLWAVVKQASLIIPVLTLMLFGILHLLQVIIGRSTLLWDAEQYHERFLPKWGKPGHVGEGLAHYPTDVTRDIVPIPVHSHNDYWRRIPLFEALHYGCIGVEADVWYFDDDLYVGHNTASLTRNRTFQNLYVNPIIDLLDKMNHQTDFSTASRHGVFDTDAEQTLVLLVDLKTDGAMTLPIVEQQLDGLRSKGYLTYFNGTDVVPGVVTVVGTGNTPFDLLISNSTYRDIFFDAPLDRLWEDPKSNVESDIEDDSDGAIDDEDQKHPLLIRRGQGNEGMDENTPASLFNRHTSYYASIDFQAAVGQVWRGHLSPRQINIIRGQIRGAKKHGLKARYWDTPVWPLSLRNHIWHILVREGADMLNADDLRAASRQDWRMWRHEWW